MRLRIISDVHAEFYSSSSYLRNKLDKLFGISKDNAHAIPEDEILIIAGDLGVAGTGLKNDKNLGTKHSGLSPEYKVMLEYFASRWKRVILVPGNHEYYDRHKSVSLNDIDAMINKECEELGITFLNKDYVIIEDPKDPKNIYAILGCTLWSEATKEAYKNMNDRLKAILSHSELLQTHHEHKTWLRKTLHSLHKKDYKTIVVTHHLPLMELTHPKYLESEHKHLNSAYASKLNSLFEALEPSKIHFYCCGHTHEKTETVLYGTRFLINPLGYPRESKITTFKTEHILI